MLPNQISIKDSSKKHNDEDIQLTPVNPTSKSTSSLIKPLSSTKSTDNLKYKVTTTITNKYHPSRPSLLHSRTPSLQEIEDDNNTYPEENELLHQQDEMSYPEGGLKAWSVVIAACLGLICDFGLMNTTGAIESYISANILTHESSTSISWIFAIYSFLAFGMNLVSGTLFDLMGARKLCCIGAALIVAGLFATANSTQIWQFILGFSVCCGVGCSLMMAPLVSCISHFFKEKRGFALAIAMPGASIGGVIWPLVCRTLYPKIGFTWTIRTLGFIFLGTLILSCVLIDDRLFEVKEFEKLKNGGVDPNSGKSTWEKIKQNVDLKVMNDKTYIWLVISLFLNEFSLILVTTYVASYALHKGYSESTALIALTVLNASGIMGRYLPTHLSDHYGNFNLIIACSVLMTLSIFAFWLPLGDKLPTFLVFNIIYGFGMAGTLALTPLCTSAISKPQDVGKRYGTAYFFVSFGNLICLPVGMQITKTKAGYNGMVAFAGVTCALSTVCLMVTRFKLAGFKRAVV